MVALDALATASSTTGEPGFTSIQKHAEIDFIDLLELLALRKCVLQMRSAHGQHSLACVRLLALLHQLRLWPPTADPEAEELFMPDAADDTTEFYRVVNEDADTIENAKLFEEHDGVVSLMDVLHPRGRCH